MDTTAIETRIDSELPSLDTYLSELVISTQGDAEEAADFLTTEIIPRRKAVEAFFEPLTTAAHHAHKLLCEKRKAVLAKLDEPERAIRAKLLEWQSRCEQEQRDALAAARAEARTEGHALVAVPPAPAPIAGVSFSSRAVVRVVDMRALCQAIAEGKVPVDMVSVNQSKLDALARSLGELFAVPGCAVEQQSQIRARA